MSPMVPKLLASLLFFSPALLVRGDPLGKDTMVDDFKILDEREEHKPPMGRSTITPWVDKGSYPKFCYDIAAAAKSDEDPRPNCAIEDVEVFQVEYNDCIDRPWTMCRCTWAQASIQEVVDSFGRVAPAVRSHVIHVMALDGTKPDGSVSASGASVNNRFVVTGPINDAVFQHEAFHSIDKGFSESKEFTEAIAADSCVPDPYSNSSPAENFAQLATWLSYDINATPVGTYIEKDQACMGNQLGAVRWYAGKDIDLIHSRCFDRKDNDEIVQADGSNRSKTRAVTPPMIFDFEDDHEW